MIGRHAPTPHLQFTSSTRSSISSSSFLYASIWMRLGTPTWANTMPPAVLGVLVQQPVDGPDPLGNPLGVIDPLDPQAQDLSSSFSRCRQRTASRSTSALVAAAVCCSKSMLIGNGRTRVEWPAAPHLRPLAIGPRLEVPVHRLQEVLAVVSQVEADQVVAQQAVEQFLLPGEGAEHLGLGQGMCQNWATIRAGLRRLSIRGSSPKW